ncbi:unnamed protein product, partial [marine sediment metagenome]
SKDNYEKCHGDPEILFIDIFGKSLEIPEIEDVDMNLLYELLYQTNLKLDRMMNLLEGKDGKEYQSTERGYVNVSGSGIRFVVDEKFEIGDIVALRLSLLLVSKTRLNLLGKVVSVRKTDTAGKYSISIHFIDLSEEDREKIVKYVFKKQRKLLRETNK